MKFNDTFLRILQANLKTGRIIPALMGEPGIGKTSFVQSLAEKLGTEMFVIQANQLSEKADLTGVRTVPIEDAQGKTTYTQVFFPHQTIHDVNEYAKAHPDETPILDLEEINRTDSDVTSALLTLSTERVCGNTKLEDNIRIIVTGNTRGNVNVLDSASLSRFAIYEMEADGEVFLDLMGNELNPYIRDVLEKNPELIFIKPENGNETYSAQTAASQNDHEDDDDDGAYYNTNIYSEEEMIQFTTPRTVHGLSCWLNEADDALLRELLGQQTKDNITMLQAVLQAHTGDTQFTAEVALAIMTDLSKPQGTRNTHVAGAVTAPQQPQSYTHITNLSYHDEIEQYINNLTTDECEDLFIYTMTAPYNNINTSIIKVLSNTITGFNNKNNIIQFVQLITANIVQKMNIEELEKTNSGLYKSLENYLDLGR